MFLDGNKNLSIDKISELISGKFNKISKLCNEKITYEIEDDIFNEKEQFWIKNEINSFNKHLKEIKQKLLELKRIEDSNKINELIINFFNEFEPVIEKELNFNIKYFRALCEKSEERTLLIYFHYKLMKLFY